jgi:ABC-type multidrug transport system fused ATPase/permease subunit
MRFRDFMRRFPIFRVIPTLQALRYPHAGLLIAGAAGAAIIFTLSQLAMPWVLKQIIDSGLLASNVRILTKSAIELVALALLSSGFLALHTLQLTALSESALRQFRSYLLKHLLGTRIAYFDTEHSGKMVSLFLEDASGLTKIFYPALSEVLLGVCQILSIIALVSVQYGRLAFLSLLAIPLYLVFPLVMGRSTREASADLMDSKGRFTAVLQEMLEAVREIKAFVRAGWSVARLDHAGGLVQKRQLRLTGIQAAASLNYALYWITVGFLYWFCGKQVIAGRLSVGGLVALIWYLSLLDSPIRRFLSVYGQIQGIMACAERLGRVLDFRSEPCGTRELSKSTPCAVEFRGVSLRYDTQQTNALSDISFSVTPGMQVAVVGPSGSGKSTLIRVLMRFYDPSEGTVLINGHDIRDYDVHSLRNMIGIVFQEPFIFDDTVEENLCFGSDVRDISAIRRAAIVARADEFIRELPKAYQTKIGERGARLSSGQKQRLAIARVVLKNAKLLIWDEATSALDAESEHAVRAAMQDVMRSTTTFTIAHDLRTVMDADLIAVLDQGRLVGLGKHDRLLHDCNVYRRLYSIQFDKAGEREVLT